MSRRLPPLNALRTFEAAARRGGFARAAEELHVTAAAVSHQVKTLESHLGKALFHRRARGLVLTDAGRQLLPQLSRGLDHLARAVGALEAEGLAGRLTVSTAASFATLWLLPRLDGFLRAYPEIQLRVLASDDPPDLAAGEADIRIPYGMGSYPGLDVQPLMREHVTPVCSPTLLNQARLDRFADLRHHTLLHDIGTDEDEPTMTWRRWLRDAGVSGVDPERGVEFGNSVMLTEAAANGQGVALGRTSLVGAYLASGRLIRPLKASRPADYAYYTVATQAGSESARVQAFRRWIEARVERDNEPGEVV